MNTYTTRTDQEIIDRIEVLNEIDPFGFSQPDLILCLPFESAKPFLRPDTTAEEWGDPKPRDAESVKERMLEYMPFAWEKANGNRGISAARSMLHMGAWLWLLGMDEAADQIQEYEFYGKPWLRAICEHFGWDWKQWDDGRWTNDELADGGPAPEHVTPLAVKG